MLTLAALHPDLPRVVAILWLQRGISRYRINDFSETVRDLSRAI